MLDENELLPKEKSRSRLGLSQDAIVIYVQLGAGEINEIESEVRQTVDALLKNSKVHIVLGESMIGPRIELDLERVRVLRDYPNSMYFRGFDATVQAGGYNSFHETRKFGLPALFYPNMNTGMDDQLARCNVADIEGWGKVVQKRTHDNILLACEDLLNRLKNSSTIPKQLNGADILSTLLMEGLK
jgi:UDP:flavonoid glycosyltransferase YjiC (YdhE family)